MPGFPSTIEMNVGDAFTDSYVMFKGNVDFKNNSVSFIISNQDILRIDVRTHEFPIYTYFDVVALGEGEASFYVQSYDGKAISDEIKVIITATPESEAVIEGPNESESASRVESETESESESETETEKESTIESEPQNDGKAYVLNTSSKKIHLPACSYISNMKEENKKEFTGDIAELYEQGYEACKRCNP